MSPYPIQQVTVPREVVCTQDSMIVQPDAAVVSPAGTALQFGAAPLRQMSGMPRSTFGWCAKLWQRFPFPVRELCSDLQHPIWFMVCVTIPDVGVAHATV